MNVFVIIIIIIFVCVIITLLRIEKYEVKYIKSDIDGEEYLVRDLPDKQQASNLLAKVKKNMMTLVNYLYEHKDEKENKEYVQYIMQLKNRLVGVVINESADDSAYTSYSVNKGEQIVFCLRSKRILNKLHDLNLVMYVALHEMAHVGCPEYGHTALFKKIFAFLCTVAIKIGIYSKVNFNFDPTEYCGLMITESII